MRNKFPLAIITFLLAQIPLAAQTYLTLRKNAIIRADVVSVADLLPENAPNGIRMQAREIALGKAPGIGAQRTVDRAEILRAIGNSTDLSGELRIPPSITLTRWSRLLTREEIAQAIAKSLEANGVSNPLSLSAEDVTFDSPIAVVEAEPTLNVMRVEPLSRSLGTHVALWTASEPRTPPFWVTVDKEFDVPPITSQRQSAAAPKGAAKIQPVANAAEESAGPSRTGAREQATVRYISRSATPAISPGHATAASEAPPLVRVGNRIQLIVQGSGMRITAKATALETGREGQNIRVKCEPAGKVLVAKIVAAQVAEIDY
jgi:hypothetical protein